MSKIICVSESFPQHPRLTKVAEFINYDYNYDVNYILWDRNSDCKSMNENHHIFSSKIKYGNKIAKLFNIPLFIRFTVDIINKNKPKIVIFRNWSTFLFISLFINKKIYIIYDVCDMPNNKMIRKIEQRFIKKANQIVLSSRYFSNFYNSNNNNVIVLENRISKSIIELKKYEKKNTEKIRITFLGKIRYYSILKNLIDSSTTFEDIELHFYGDGPDFDKIKHYCLKYNFKYVYLHGKYLQSEISKIYFEADLIWCAYPNDKFNVKYAISNKFFETMAFKVPGVFSNNTSLSEEINTHRIGFVVDPYKKQEIMNLINSVISNKKILSDFSENIKKYEKDICWENYLVKKG